MLNTEKLQIAMSVLLLAGTLLATAFVTFGGLFFLIQHGQEDIAAVLPTLQPHYFSLSQWLLSPEAFNSITIIQIGLVILVLTQVLRVILVDFFFIVTKDLWFSLISLFVLITLLYSLF